MRLLNAAVATLLAISLNVMAKDYGEPLTLTEITKISKILETPEDFVGKKVLVNGTVTSVCSKRGCWMNLASDKAFEQIQIKVVDGVIVFPMSAHGKSAKVEGIIERLGNYIPKVTASKNKENHTGDAQEHTKNKYRIRAIGAVISE